MISLYIDGEGKDTGEKRTTFDLPMFLVRAASIGDMKHVKICVEIKKIDINSTDECGRSSFYWAAANGHLDVMMYLLQKGATNKERPYSPFFAAAGNGHLPVLQFFVDQVVELSAPANEFEKAYVIRSYINKPNADIETPLFIACQNGHVDVVTYLLELGADVDCCNKRGVTCLRIATERGHFSIMEMLVDKGAEINKADDDGLTPLHRSARKGNVDMVTLLVTNGADLNVKDRWNSSPLAKTRKEPIHKVLKEEEERRIALEEDDELKRLEDIASGRAVREVLGLGRDSMDSNPAISPRLLK